MLSEVIEAEKEIQKCLELEKIKVREWLETVEKESEEQFRRQENEIKNVCDTSLEEAAKASEAEASRTVSRAAARSERLRQLPAETLSRFVEEKILKILPNI